MQHLLDTALAVIRDHSEWAGAVMFVAAFGESFVFVSLAFPGTSLLVAAGTLVSTGHLHALPVIAGAVLGAVLGDSVSFWIGRRFGGTIAGIWPFTRHPDLLPTGIHFFARHGGKSVFLGRFFGPVRAVIPLAAGIMRMKPARFWLANVSSALVWGPMLLFAGDVIGRIGQQLFGSTTVVLLVFGGLVLIGLGGVALGVFHAHRSRKGPRK